MPFPAPKPGRQVQAKFKANGEIIDYRTGRVRSIKTYWVFGATTAADALAAHGLPPMQQEHPRLPQISVKNYQVRAPEKGLDTYEVDVIYESPSGNIPPPDVIYRRSQIGATTVPVETTLDGQMIGSDTIFDPAAEGFVFWEDHLPIGTDVFFPTIDFEIIMPVGTPNNGALWFDLDTHVNSIAFNALGWIFPPHTCQYMGAVEEPVNTYPLTYRYTHQFRAARMVTPTTLDVQHWNGTAWVPWPKDYIPISYARWVVFEKLEAEGAVQPYKLRIGPIYPEADLNVLLTG